MKLKVVAHEAEEGGCWAEVPGIPGCATQGETFDDLLTSIYEGVERCLSVDVQDVEVSARDKLMEIAARSQSAGSDSVRS
jgi:predicted RNase H-like HicB family nuclease